MNLQNASLILKSCDAICDATKVNITWNNINLRTVLGDMYDKYDLFNLCLNTVSTSNSALTNANTDNNQRNVIMSLSGLPWINQTYSVNKLSNTSNTVLCTFLFFTTGNVSTQYFYSSNFATFGKNQEFVNLTLSYTRILDNSQPVAGGAEVFPDVVLVFDIFGIDETKHDITSHRMKSIK